MIWGLKKMPNSKRFGNHINIKEIHPEMKGDFLDTAKQLIQALNLRIVIAKANLEYDKNRLSELTVGLKNNYSKKTENTIRANIVRFEETLKSYTDTREMIYKQCEYVLRHESEDYRNMFIALFLDNLDEQEITKLYGYDSVAIKSAKAYIMKDMFDKNYDESEEVNAIDNIQDNGRNQGENETEGS